LLAGIQAEDSLAVPFDPKQSFALRLACQIMDVGDPESAFVEGWVGRPEVMLESPQVHRPVRPGGHLLKYLSYERNRPGGCK
jgi:hypothetical protein